ncbi:cation:dicarboxylate symporter family transporter [Endozoicomonas ascidiicola]|uniref:cation:dicarboxylate symporter family transporter n=1 Tax=Endozoicomonas ascidiicola TaxID=1698521 RepID=UPI00082BAAE7|nr:cation:dicarboxylase symporter family transporter [Endozoicomonas ascidiicola]
MNVIGYINRVKLPLSLIVARLIPVLTDSLVSYDVAAFFYSVSLTIKSVLVFILPFIVFSFMVSCFCRLGRNAFFFCVLLVLGVFTSNILAIFTGYLVGIFTVPMLTIQASSEAYLAAGLGTLWTFQLVPLFSSMNALVAGFLVGCLINLLKLDLLKPWAYNASDGCGWFLSKIFIPILPLFILGFSFKLHADGMLTQAVVSYGPILLLVVMTQVCYLTCYYFIAANFSIRKCFSDIAKVFPAFLTGLSTVSSAACLPVLINSTEKITGSSLMARTIVPATVNIHTIGSAIGLTMLSLVTLRTFSLPLPDIYGFTLFAFFYAIAKFSVVAVPGGVILVVGPILQSLLGFTDEMLGLMTAVYMIFDPFGTAMNIGGNGAFAMIFAKMSRFMGLIEEAEVPETTEECGCNNELARTN